MHRAVSFVRTSKDVSPQKHVKNEKVVCASCRYTLEDGFDTEGDYKNPLSLDALFIQHPAATYFVVVGKRSEITISENEHIGVLKGDILTIDRAITPSVGKLVLAVHDGSFLLSRLVEHKGERFLIQNQHEHMALSNEADTDTYIWGTVSSLSRKV